MPDLNAILVHFSPELILVIGALVVLAYDLVVRRRDGGQAWLTVVTLVAAIAATLWLYTVPPPAATPVEIETMTAGLTVSCGQFGIFEVRSGASGDVVRCGTFVADGFTQFFRLAGMIAALLVVLSGMSFMRKRSPFRGEFFSVLLFATLAMCLMSGANDLVVIALSLEFLSISSYVLTGFLRGEPLSIEGGLKYFLYGSIAGACMLFGFSLIYGITGTTSLPAVAAVLAQPESTLVADLVSLAVPALLLVLVGVGFKIALVPFHQWSPDAYEGAPTPVTAFLSVGPKLAGFAVLLRLVMTAYGGGAYTSLWLPTLTGVAVLTMVFGNIVALSQNNVKRMMAYSSIAQAGYMLVGLIAAGAAASAMGAVPATVTALGSVLVFLFAYLFTNLGAFAVIIAVDDATGSSDIASYSGLMRRSPLLGAALAVFFLSLVGIPPLAGFIGKFSVFRAAIQSGQVGLALVGVLTGVISVGYYFRVVRHAFFAAAAPDAPAIRVAPYVRLVIVVALFMTLLIGVYADPFIRIATDAAATIVPAAASLVAGVGGG